jgi:hypothetical protein
MSLPGPTRTKGPAPSIGSHWESADLPAQRDTALPLDQQRRQLSLSVPVPPNEPLFAGSKSEHGSN